MLNFDMLSETPCKKTLRTPGSSVSNRGPLVAGRQGLYFGHCIQLMMSMYTAVQDAHKPNGSINGINETGRGSCGSIRLDPIMSEVWRCLGLETHEGVGAELPTACSMCGKLLPSGMCSCTMMDGLKAPQRSANINPVTAKLCRHLSKMNLDVHVQWRHSEAELQEPRRSEVPPESARWEAVPPERGRLAMADAQRRHWRDRTADKVTCMEKVVDGRCVGIVFEGNPPLARVLADQFVLAMRASQRQASWSSGDHSDGYLVVSSHSREVFRQALQRAASFIREFRDTLKHFLEEGRSLRVNSLHELSGGISLGVEAGGTLQVHTNDTSMKQAAMGVMDFAHAAQRVHRAFLVNAPSLVLLPLLNPSFAEMATSNEQTLRAEFQRNVLNYLYLATTLVALPLCRHFQTQGHPHVLEAELLLDNGCDHVAASHIISAGKRLFFKDVVLGANPYARGWCKEKRLPLKLMLHRARVENYPTAWQELEKLANQLLMVPCANDVETSKRLDAALTSSMPPMNMIDHRPAFNIVVRDMGAFQQMEPEVCGHGVLGAKPMTAELPEMARMYCVGCRDCIRYFEPDASAVEQSIADLEDTTAAASTFFHRIDSGNRRRLFEQTDSKRKRTAKLTTTFES